MKQNWITAAYYRGGTSKGVFFQAKDLPTASEDELSKIFFKSNWKSRSKWKTAKWNGRWGFFRF